MFIKRSGRRCLLLHSVRDGRGIVGHRRLGHFWDAASLERCLAALPQSAPEFEPDIERIRDLAQKKLSVEPCPKRAEPEQRVEKVRKAVRSLLTFLAEEDDPQVLAAVLPELDRLRARLADFEGEGARELDRARSALAPRRRRFDPSERQAEDYLGALDRLWDDLEQGERWEECLKVAQQRVEASPDEESRLRYGHLLHRLGRPKEAMEQYRRLSPRSPLRHYNLVAACFHENGPDEALDHLLRGLVADPWRLWTQDYWDQFGDCWTQPAREFTYSILAQHLVRHKLNRSIEAGIKPRKLVPTRSKGWLLEKALDPMKPPPSKFGLRPPVADGILSQPLSSRFHAFLS